jgi:putative transposase
VLMPNHAHLILVPSDADGICRALAAVHRRYAGHVRARLKRTGHFWQGYFGCIAMDEEHLGAALRYVALNPVWAPLVRHAADWSWSSLHAQLGAEGGLTATAAVVARYPDFAALIAAGEDAEASRRLRRAETIGSAAIAERLEIDSGRALAPTWRGRRRTEISALSL